MHKGILRAGLLTATLLLLTSCRTVNIACTVVDGGSATSPLTVTQSISGIKDPTVTMQKEFPIELGRGSKVSAIPSP